MSLFIPLISWPMFSSSCFNMFFLLVKLSIILLCSSILLAIFCNCFIKLSSETYDTYCIYTHIFIFSLSLSLINIHYSKQLHHQLQTCSNFVNHKRKIIFQFAFLLLCKFNILISILFCLNST